VKAGVLVTTVVLGHGFKPLFLRNLDKIDGTLQGRVAKSKKLKRPNFAISSFKKAKS